MTENFCPYQNTIKEINSWATDWGKKISAIHISNEGHLCKLRKEYLQINNKKRKIIQFFLNE